ncbi:MAG: VIT and VWA domain-containing protein [Anaerolineaceae bacterium]|nr:VIT and VWA domain-containing protein [Anaerolineaceae bacterium]
MKRRVTMAIMLTVLLLSMAVGTVSADGIIIPEPPPDEPIWPEPMRQLVIRYHHVDVEIRDQIAVTHVDQVFYNPNDWQVEGTYIFPLPAGATVSDFRMWMNNEPVQGQVLTAEEARRTYEQIVAQMRDPALLEYVGRDAVQASIFPIPPGEERRIELEYTQVLTADNGLVRYDYPLNTEKFSAWPLDDVRVTVHIESAQPIRAVYSPTHAIDTIREGERYAKASYEERNVTPDKDFSLFYSIGEAEAFHLFTYRDPSDPIDADGFFMMLLAPQPEVSSRVVSKDLILVLDRSGSMEGEKFEQARAALRYILTHLNESDRFYLQSFSSGISTYANGLRSASEADQALRWVDQMSAVGSTDINRALLEAAAVADRERPTYLIFITDGLPTEGDIEPEKILDNFARTAPDNLRLFPFGVGYDVDTFLLDTLSQENHGFSTYVQPGEALDEALSAFYARISTPVLTNLELDLGRLSAYDIYPDPLPDLFAGSQVVVTGRYRKGGVHNVRLSGEVNGQRQEFVYPEQRFTEDSRFDVQPFDDLPRLWATRKIGALLQQIRLQGNNQEWVDQVVRISIRYGIVTPYTSYLVTEPMPLGASNQRDLAEEVYAEMEAMPTAPTSGQAAVEKAADEGELSQAQVAQTASHEVTDQVRTLGAKTFVQSSGIWMDTAYDPETMTTQKVSFLSTDYFALAAARQEAGAALALGERVIVVVDGTAYEVVAEGGASSDVDLPEEVSSTGQDKTDPVGIGDIIEPLTNLDQSGGLGLKFPCSSAGALFIAALYFLIRMRS